MSDQLSKVECQHRFVMDEEAPSWEACKRCGHSRKRIESAAAPVEVGGVEGYATGMEARDMHAEANLLRTLARQLSDSEASRREAEASLAEAKAEIERLCEIEAAAVKVEEDANAFAADLERWAHDPFVCLTPMRIEDVKHHATRIRAIACNLAGARHSNREQAESALAAATRRVAEVEGVLAVMKDRCDSLDGAANILHAQRNHAEDALPAAAKRVAALEARLGDLERLAWEWRDLAGSKDASMTMAHRSTFDRCADELEAALQKEPK